MKFFYLLVLLILTQKSFAEGLICNLVNNPSASLIKIDHYNNRVQSISLRSSNETEFRELDVSITMIYQRDQNEFESFVVKPNFDESSINWEQEPNCFKQVGTQWYFNLYYVSSDYSVIFYPFYILENSNCIPPRNTPSKMILNCRSNNY